MTRISALCRVDSREQRPYALAEITSEHVDFKVSTEALPEGDYASCLTEFESAQTCLVERKSHADLMNSLTHERARFERELTRVRDAGYGYAAIVCETDIERIVWSCGRPESKVNARSIIASLIAFSQRFNVHVVYAGRRCYAELLTFRMLERWVRDRAAEQGHISDLLAWQRGEKVKA